MLRCQEKAIRKNKYLLKLQESEAGLSLTRKQGRIVASGDGYFVGEAPRDIQEDGKEQ